MLRTVCRIEIGNFVISSQDVNKTLDDGRLVRKRRLGVQEIEVFHSWEENMSTARIVLPRRFVHEGEVLTGTNDSIFSVGDRVRISLGYDGVLGGGYPSKMRDYVFDGYISKVSPRAPIEIECMDRLWLLRQMGSITKVYENVEFRDLLAEVMAGTGIPYEIVPGDLEFNIPKLTVNGASKLAVLLKLAEDYGLNLMYRPEDKRTGERGAGGARLFVGLLFLGQIYRRTGIPEVLTDAHFVLGQDNLEYQKSEDLRIRVRVLSYLSDEDRRIEEYGGDPDGELRTVLRVDISDREELRRIADREAQKLKYEGWRGDFQIFGEPYVRPMDALTLKDRFGMKPPGNYLIKSVRHSFGIDIGWKQTVELERKIP